MKKLLILLLLTACKPPVDPRVSLKAGQPVVVGVIGNSIGCGYDATNARAQMKLEGNGLMTQESEDNTQIGGWAQRLQLWLRTKNSKSIVWNLSGSGWTTQNHLDRKTVKLMASMRPKPSVVFLPLQVNDRYKAALGPGFPDFGQFEVNTELLIKEIRSYGMIPVLVKEENEPFPAGAGWAPAEYQPQPANANYHAFSEYMEVIDEIGLRTQTEIIDTYTPSLNTTAWKLVVNGSAAPADFDSTLMDVNDPIIGFNPIHPNQKGHDLILAQYQKWFMGDK